MTHVLIRLPTRSPSCSRPNRPAPVEDPKIVGSQNILGAQARPGYDARSIGR
jgi:hypothetical protein